MKLASFDCRPEDVLVHPIVVAELELGNIKLHVFGADLVEAADDPALKIDQKPSIVLVWTAPTTYSPAE